MRSLFNIDFSQSFADEVVIAKVNGDVWDLDRPFESDAELLLLKFDDPEGERHSRIGL